MAPGALPRVGDQRPALPGQSAMSAGLTAAQAQAAAHDGPILVLAGAGSGKTKTLTAAVGWRIDVLGVPASRILAVTFSCCLAAQHTLRSLRSRSTPLSSKQSSTGPSLSLCLGCPAARRTTWSSGTGSTRCGPRLR